MPGGIESRSAPKPEIKQTHGPAGWGLGAVREQQRSLLRCPERAAATRVIWVLVAAGHSFSSEDFDLIAREFLLPFPRAFAWLLSHYRWTRMLPEAARLQPQPGGSGTGRVWSVRKFVRGPPIMLSALSSVTSGSHQGQPWRGSLLPPFFIFFPCMVAFFFIFLMVLQKSPNNREGSGAAAPGDCHLQPLGCALSSAWLNKPASRIPCTSTFLLKAGAAFSEP